MKRREFITLLGSVTAGWPLVARAQQSARIKRVGVLIGFAENDPAVQSWLAAFRGTLAKLGWTEGSNLRIEVRWAGDDPDRMKTFAKELVDLRPDAILSVTTPVTNALIRETQTIPIVIVTVADPISSGFVANLGRPGGNLTGFALYEPSMGGKWLELLKQIAPGVTRVALLFNPATTVPVKFYMSSIEAAASSFAIQASTAPVHAKDEIEGVIATLAAEFLGACELWHLVANWLPDIGRSGASSPQTVVIIELPTLTSTDIETVARAAGRSEPWGNLGVAYIHDRKTMT